MFIWQSTLLLFISQQGIWLFTGDFSPSTIWDNDIYSALPNNFNLSVPRYMTADFVREMNACAKLIVMMRDPVQRYVLNVFIRKYLTL